MKATARAYADEDDFWSMREFLREVFLLNGRRDRSWHVARLEYARWHSCLNCARTRLEDIAYIWEEEGSIVAFAMPDGDLGEAHLCVHPILRTPELELEMLEVAEDRLSSRAGNGRRRLRVWAPEPDRLRQGILESRGYARNGQPEHKWRRDLEADIAEVPVAPGYAIRPLGDGLELVERCYASGLAFHEGDLAIASRNRDDVGWYRNIQNAPLYRRDLDLVAISPDGSIGAFCGMWFDDATRSACFEPVATVPAHRRRGLQRSLMSEGLRRLKRMGALCAVVGGYGPEANALYRSVMGDDLELYESWDREWD